MTGRLVISIDAELGWGNLKWHISGYRNNLRRVPEVTDQLLELFQQHAVCSTWAIVSGMTFEDATSLRDFIVEVNHVVTSPTLQYVIYDGKYDPKCFFMPGLVHKLKIQPNVEIASHTFTHFECGKSGQDLERFKEELRLSEVWERSNDLKCTSMVFPSNRWHARHIRELKNWNFQQFRGNPASWAKDANRMSQRIFRFADSLINLSGHPIKESPGHVPISNIAATRFLPATSRFALLNSLRIRRIVDGMRNAAESGTIYHLWFHPHNLAGSQSGRLDLVRAVIEAFCELRQRHGMESVTMRDAAERLRSDCTVSPC